LITQILSLGAAHAAVIPVSSITFHPEFRMMCESNACGMFGKSWMCPPHVGGAQALIQEAQAYRTAVVYQTIHPLEDSFDIEGMLEAGKQQNLLARAIQRQMRAVFDKQFLHLGAGGCRLCQTCALASRQPCRFPDEALSSLEAYCIDVSQLAQSAGMNYLNGANTVTYFGLLLLEKL